MSRISWLSTEHGRTSVYYKCESKDTTSIRMSFNSTDSFGILSKIVYGEETLSPFTAATTLPYCSGVMMR
jgi:hypothetical protein